MKPLKTLGLRANTLPSSHASKPLPFKHLINQLHKYREKREELMKPIENISLSTSRYTVREA
jgi:hypothetical protein